MRVVTVSPMAKINLVLRVGPARADGFHEVRTLLQTIAAGDTLRLTGRRGPLSLHCATPGVPTDRTNLVWRAADALWAAAGRPGPAEGVAMRLTKRVPHAAGLGGGSADAAAALAGLNRLWRCGLRVADLRQIAAGLGADVPFFLVGGAALGAGKGEELYPVTDIRRTGVVIVKPDFGVGTGDAYRWVDSDRAAGRPDEAAGRVRQVDVGWPSGPLTVANDMEAAVGRRHPEILAIIEAAYAHGATAAAMSGSGSAVFALVPERRAAALGRRLAGLGRRVLVTRTLGRAEALRRLGLTGPAPRG